MFMLQERLLEVHRLGLRRMSALVGIVLVVGMTSANRARGLCGEIVSGILGFVLGDMSGEGRQRGKERTLSVL